ncbi:hypothetical protein [Nonomuraea sp. NPDC050310]|uniref:hypothetical protein n=1 Tax=Nonomuraea sp. NPDC050310 TaxID=3154935 RepID=UPI0033D487C7
MYTTILPIVGALIVGIIVGAVCFSNLITRLDLSGVANPPARKREHPQAHREAVREMVAETIEDLLAPPVTTPQKPRLSVVRTPKGGQ